MIGFETKSAYRVGAPLNNTSYYVKVCVFVSVHFVCRLHFFFS